MIKGKKVISMILIIVMLVTNILTTSAQENNNENSIQQISILTPEIPEGAIDYAERTASELIGNILVIADLFDITVNNPADFFIGTPFTVINTNKKQLEAVDVYYFPIVENTEVKLIMQVFLSGGEWHDSVSKDFSEELNKLKFMDNSSPFIIYCEGNNYYAQNSKKLSIISTYTNLEQDPQKETNFCELSYDEIIDVITNRNISIKQINLLDSTLEIGNTVQTIVEKSTLRKNARASVPGFSAYTDTNKVLEMAYCLLNQDTDNICWAACLGTAYRYRTGNRTVTSTTIANMFKNVWLGATMNEIASFANSLNIGGSGNSYKAVNNSVSHFSVQHNINNRFPFFMGSITSNGGHALLGIGYLMVGDKMHVIFWDPDAAHGGGVKSTNAFLTTDRSPIAYYYGPVIHTWDQTALLIP